MASRLTAVSISMEVHRLIAVAAERLANRAFEGRNGRRRQTSCSAISAPHVATDPLSHRGRVPCRGPVKMLWAPLGSKPLILRLR
jgi:hypothetical protein